MSVGVNYRLKTDDIAYIFDHAEVDIIIVDREFRDLLAKFEATERGRKVKLLVDTDTDRQEGEYDRAVLEGLEFDRETGGRGWDGLQTHTDDEDSLIALAYTSGTTARPKGVEYTHRGCYLAAMGNVIESGLNYNTGRAKYLWTLPMFHATGWTFPVMHPL